MRSLAQLQEIKILLASGSPRRQNLIKGLNIPFEVVQPPDIKEDYPTDLDLFNVPSFLAKKKAGNYSEHLKPETILLTADTVVLCGNKILNKPGNYDEAFEMLSNLSGNKHTVITGVCLKSQLKEHVFSSITDVYFSELSEEEIRFYLSKYQPYDKAGAYGIQEWIGYIGVDRIDGSFFNVMGLPLHSLYAEIKNF